MDEQKNMPPIYVVSGGKGVAGHTIVETILIQYPDNMIPVIVEPDVLKIEQIEEITERVKASNGAIAHSMVNHNMRKALVKSCEAKAIPNFDLVGGLADYLDKTLDIRPVEQPGLFRLRNIEYFRRVRAIEFTISHDDGTSIQISGVTNGVHQQRLVGGPYQVFVRWSEPSTTIEEHKKQLAETIALVKQGIESGDIPAGANWMKRLERAQNSDRIAIMANRLGPIPKADRIRNKHNGR